jgi:methylthioribose-1-phosphate isomerase
VSGEREASGVAGVPSPVRLSGDGRTVHILDQTLLPALETILDLGSPAGVAEAIRALRVRGAPAIGISAAYAVAIGFAPEESGLPTRVDREWARGRFQELATLLAGTRPTAVNLRWALDRMGRALETALGDPADPTAADLHRVLVAEARAIHGEDARACSAIGRLGSDLLPRPTDRGELRVMTICNAGALATGGIGTALAPVYHRHARGEPVAVLAPETRPLLQGARLTAWELSRAGVPVTVLTDSAVGAAMALGRVDVVVVGADRIAANGDVANKIGTYPLSVLAATHDIPFYVAAPTSTFDPDCPSGGEIPIEERSGEEVRPSPDPSAPGAGPTVWNPAFDVTPRERVTAYITEVGIARSPEELGGEP